MLSWKSGAASTRGLCNLATAEAEMICGWHMARGTGLQMDKRPLFTAASLPPKKNNTVLGTHRGQLGGITHILRPLRASTRTQQPLRLTSSLMATHTQHTDPPLETEPKRPAWRKKRKAAPCPGHTDHYNLPDNSSPLVALTGSQPLS